MTICKNHFEARPFQLREDGFYEAYKIGLAYPIGATRQLLMRLGGKRGIHAHQESLISCFCASVGAQKYRWQHDPSKSPGCFNHQRFTLNGIGTQWQVFTMPFKRAEWQISQSFLLEPLSEFSGPKFKIFYAAG